MEKLITENFVDVLMERSHQEYPEDYYIDPGTGEPEDRNEAPRFAYVRGFTHGVEASLATGWRPSEAQMEALYDAIGRFDSDTEGTQTLQSLFDDLRKLYHNGSETQE